MKHYVVVLDWATEDDNNIHILGVAHTISEAQEIFAKHIDEQRQIADEDGYVVEEDNGWLFDAGIMGYWRDNHITLYIEEAN